MIFIGSHETNIHFRSSLCRLNYDLDDEATNSFLFIDLRHFETPIVSSKPANPRSTRAQRSFYSSRAIPRSQFSQRLFSQCSVKYFLPMRERERERRGTRWPDFERHNRSTALRNRETAPDFEQPERLVRRKFVPDLSLSLSLRLFSFPARSSRSTLMRFARASVLNWLSLRSSRIRPRIQLGRSIALSERRRIIIINKLATRDACTLFREK